MTTPPSTPEPSPHPTPHPAPHPGIASLAFLLGTWRGEGRGEYPTIEAFTYTEEVTYAHVGKPFVSYVQRTRSSEGTPLHAEVGYVRPVGSDRAELVIAQPSGITEVHTGTVAGTRIDFGIEMIGLTPTAKEVTSVARLIRVDGDELSYRLDMAAVGQPEQFHLEAVLHRVG